MGLFSKKVCDICGGDIGLLGNRKLSDGNCCKDCAHRLSPYLSDRRGSTVAEIRDHLAYRDANFVAVQDFHPTRVLGEYTKIYLDETTGRFLVSHATDWRKFNPDIIDVRQVISCTVDVQEHRREIAPPPPPAGRPGPGGPGRPGPGGPAGRPMPPRVVFEYEFVVTILVDSPYFDRIRFELTRERPEARMSQAYRYYEAMGAEIMACLDPANYAAPAIGVQPVINVVAPAAPAAAPAGDSWTCACGAVNTGKFCTGCGAGKPAAPAAPAAEGWTCTCGAVNTGKFCPNCGASKPKTIRCDKCGWVPADPTNAPKFCPNCGDPITEDDLA